MSIPSAASARRFARYAWAVLFYNLPVILFGAVVRATGSGAGCGPHWPLCGEASGWQRTVEFTHRLSSGMVLPLTFLLFIWSLRAFDAGHPTRRGALFAFLLTISEALIGAGLVLFRLVAHNESAGRVFAISAHLVNTFLLLGALALTAWWSSGGPAGRIRGQRIVGYLLGSALACAIIIGITGAFTALVDTLFPAGSLVEGFRQDVAPTAHLMVRLRLWHPVIAVGAGAWIVAAAALVSRLRPNDHVKNGAWIVAMLFGAQIAVGMLNLVMLVPIPMQLLHLLLADSLWIAVVLLAAAAIGVETTQVETAVLRSGRAIPVEGAL